MKKIIVFGATGKVGRRVVKYALAAGHQVTAFVRNPADFPKYESRLLLFVGDALEPVALEKALEEHEVVISALGARSMENVITLMSDALGKTIAAMKKVGIKRILAVAGAGILHQKAGILIKDNPDFPDFLQNVSSDHLRMYHLLRNTDLKWTLVCPPTLIDEERSEEYVTEKDYFPETGQNEVSAGDVADFLVREAETNEFIDRRVGGAARA